MTKQGEDPFNRKTTTGVSPHYLMNTETETRDIRRHPLPCLFMRTNMGNAQSILMVLTPTFILFLTQIVFGGAYASMAKSKL